MGVTISFGESSTYAPGIHWVTKQQITISTFQISEEINSENLEGPPTGPSEILFQLIEGDSYLFPGKNLEFGELDNDGGDAEMESEYGELKDAIAGMLDDDKMVAGWWVMEGFTATYTKDYYGEVDCTHEFKLVRLATKADLIKYGFDQEAQALYGS